MSKGIAKAYKTFNKDVNALQLTVLKKEQLLDAHKAINQRWLRYPTSPHPSPVDDSTICLFGERTRKQKRM